MKRFHCRIPASQSKIRLDDYLVDWLSQAMGQSISKSRIRALIMGGGVYVNRHRTKIPTHEIYSGATLEVYFEDDKKVAPPRTIDSFARVSEASVRYEDEDLLVIEKPAGMPTQPTVDPGRANLFDLVKELLKRRKGTLANSTPDPYVGLHHRLDRDTSGLVLFTKREQANKGVADLFRDHQIEKTYQCVCWIQPGATPVQDEFQIDNFLGKIHHITGKSKYGPVTSGGDRAITDFRVIEKFRDSIWLAAKPKTGRTHQIRVHMAHIGMPLIGDQVYGDTKAARALNTALPEEVRLKRQALHAETLAFTHPATSERMSFQSDLPDDLLALRAALSDP